MVSWDKPGVFMSTKSLLSHLPKLPPLDAATAALFQAISEQNPEQVAGALEAGAKLNAIQPYFAEANAGDIGGGVSPLQAACSVYPQRLLSLPIVAMLLEAGADPRLQGELGEDTLSVLCQRLPANGPQAIALLAQHGVIPDLSHLRVVMGARKTWMQDIKTTPMGEAPALDALWAHLPADQRKKLDPSWMMSVVSDHSAALSYAQIKMVQWLSNHCQEKPQPTFQDRVENRRTNEEAPVMGAPSNKLH